MSAPAVLDHAPVEGADPTALRAALEREALRRRLPLPPDMARGVLRREAVRRGLPVFPTFRSFVEERNPSLLRYEHVQMVLPAVERIVRGELPRVLVFWPTQYHKSEIFSRLLPAYWLARSPSHMVALASYGADLAWELSGDARDHFAAVGGRFRDGNPRAATRHWRTVRQRGASGGLWATGIGGPGLGRGYNLGIVDDAISPLQVESAAYRARFAKWWPSVWLRGQRPGGSTLIVVQQRLAVDDPAGWLLAREQDPRTAEHWHILAYDEIRRDEPFANCDGPRGFPATCTVEPDPRPIGRVLAPTWRAPAEVEKLQATAGPLVAAAQRQQRPMLPAGDFWAARAFEGRTYDTLPADAYNGGWDWDTAYTKDAANSATAGVRSFRGPGDLSSCRIYIEDVWWDWLEFPDLVARLRAAAGPHYVEKKATGKSLVQVLATYGVPAVEVTVTGDKLKRASAAQPAVTAGRVYVNARVVHQLLSGEAQGLLRITAEALHADRGGLDLNDAFVQAIWRHLNLGEPPKRKVLFG